MGDGITFSERVVKVRNSWSLGRRTLERLSGRCDVVEVYLLGLIKLRQLSSAISFNLPARRLACGP